MASVDASSESDQYRGRSALKPSRRTNKSSNNVDNLAGTLQATNRNLRVVDKMLEEYKDMGEQQSTAMDRLKDDLVRTTDQLRDEKMRQSSRDRGSQRSMRTTDLDGDHSRERRRRRRGPTSPLRDYNYDHERSFSDRENGDYDRRRKPMSSAIRFYDDMDAGHHLHDLHQSLRDVSSEQLRMDDDLQREIDRRHRYEHQSKQKDRPSSAIGTAISSVDQRLQSIQDELKSERLAMKKRQEEVGQVSQELRQALDTKKDQTSKPAHEEVELKNRLAQAQTFTHTIEELRKQLSRSEDERQHLRQRLQQQNEELQNRNKRKQIEEHESEQREHERRRLEEELRELRGQLGKSAVVVGDYADLRRELERSEKQRDQLSDHIQVLKKEVEGKEKHTAKVITQLQDTNERLEETERGRRQALVELETTLRKLQEVTNVAESSGRELHDTKQKLGDSEKRKEEIKARAQETVRQWKLKCKKLERDADRFKHSGEQSANRGEQLVRELEATRTQHGTATQQLDHLKRELSELLAIRAQQDEQVRIKDIEVNELRSLRLDMDKELRDCKVVMERMENELHSVREKVAGVNEERSRLEEQITGMQSSQIMSQQQASQLQQEVRELSMVKVEMAAQLADAANQRQELRIGLQESRQAETASKQQVETLVKRNQEEKDFYTKRIDSLQGELDNYRSHESHKVQEIARRMKKAQAEYEAEIQVIKLQLEEERSAGKILRRQQEKMQTEVDRVNGELARSQEEIACMERKYHKVKEEYICKSQATEDGLSRARETELDLLDSKELWKKVQKDYQNLLLLISTEVDALVEVVAADAIKSYKTLVVTKELTSEPQKWLAEVKSKLAWVRSEIQQQKAETKRLRLDVRDAVIGSERDRQMLVTELERQNTALDQMNRSMNGDVVTDTITTLPSTQADIHISQVDVSDEPVKLSSIRPAVDVTQLQSESERLVQETKLERERINQRYSKLQETMNLLKRELSETHLRADLSKSCLSNGPRKGRCTTPTKSPRRVRISSPPTRSASPSPTRHISPSRHTSRSRTPPPLALSDEEFMAQFVPKSPKITVPNDSTVSSVK